MSRLLSIALIFAAWVLPLSAFAQDPQPVAGYKLFEGPLLDIFSPAGDGWSLVDGGQAMIFMREGEQRHASDIASVNSFPVAADADTATFEALVREEIRKGVEGDRYQSLPGSSLTVVQHGTAHCLRYAQAVIDRAAQVGRGKTRQMVLDVHGLYCRHPANPELGIALIYSVRAPKREPEQTASAADAFFDSLALKPEPVETAPAEN